MITLEAQLQCAERALAMRRKEYPALVARGKLRRATAERELAGMTAIVETLTRLVQHEHARQGDLFTEARS